MQGDKRLQGLAEIVAGGSEKTRLPEIRPLRLHLGNIPRILQAFALRYIRKGDHHAFDAVILGAVGQDATGVPGTVLAGNLTRKRHEIGEHGPSVVEEISI